MENLNAEQVKSELEGLVKFNTCPDYIIDALTLITSLEQKNKKLTEENERLRTDNEILKMPRATIFEIADAFDRGRKKGKSDTVRKVQEKTKKTISALCKGDVSEILKIVDQIAKEMLEGEK